MSLHYCDSCKHTIHDIKAPSCIRLVEAWVAGSGKTILKIEQEGYRFYHKHCFEMMKRKEAGWQEESLF